MLTDKNKWDLIIIASAAIMRADDKNIPRIALGTEAHWEILDFIINNPDICAAEIHDFFIEETSHEELERLAALFC